MKVLSFRTKMYTKKERFLNLYFNKLYFSNKFRIKYKFLDFPKVLFKNT